MYKILKFHLPHSGLNAVLVPAGADILSVQGIGRDLFVYALCQDGLDIYEQRIFLVVGTGVALERQSHPLTNHKFIDTVKLDGEVNPPEFWHIFLKNRD